MTRRPPNSTPTHTPVPDPPLFRSTVVPFKPNRAQRQLIARLWHRNIILKARQLGFTTLVCIIWLDHALFNADQRCGIVAQDREAAEVIFRDKVKLDRKSTRLNSSP